jgi:hypothetical protein
MGRNYKRYGVTSLFTVLNARTGATIAACHRRHRHQFLRFLNNAAGSCRRSISAKIFFLSDRLKVLLFAFGVTSGSGEPDTRITF